jgi:tRNA modification GTPase
MGAGGTIAAITSPRGPGRRGVLRLSGPRAWELLAAVWCGDAPLPERGRRGFHEGRFDDGRGQQPLLCLWMPGPRSFTREDVVEFHLPGSPPLLEAALARLLALGARAAGPGEFTRRAFENGRIDLTRAEGLLELVQARGEAERRSACALLFGGLAERLASLREGLDALRSLAEASLDFDEADTGHVPSAELEQGARKLLEGLRAAAGWEARRVARSDLPQVVLLGRPNAGKSTLFNALVSGASALVSPLPGTTRDVLHGVWPTPGGDLRLVDTAGLDPLARGPDAQAQHLARSWRAGADLCLWVVDGRRAEHPELLLEKAECGGAVPLVLVWSHGDLQPRPLAPPGLAAGLGAELEVCAPSGAGLAELAHSVCELLALDLGEGAGGERLEREIGVRHRVALECAAERLETGLAAWLAGLSLDLFAESLREATAELDTISGRTTPEDVLDRIFAAFCLGK